MAALSGGNVLQGAVRGGIFGGIGGGLSAAVTYRQAVLDRIRRNELKGVKFRYRPKYDPNEPEFGRAIPFEKSTVGPKSFKYGKYEVIDTMVHEEFHQRHYMRADFSNNEAHVRALTARYMFWKFGR